MSDPTWTEAWNQAKARINQFQKLSLFCNTNSPNWLGLEDTLIQLFEGEYIAGIINTMKQDRASLSAILAPTNIQAALTPHLYEIARVAGIAERDVRSILPKLRRYMHTNSYSVQERNLNWPTITAGGSNAGNGNIRRLIYDRYGYELEGVFLEAKTFRCDADQGSRPKHAEVFTFEGVEAEVDYLRVLGSGSSTAIGCSHAGVDSTGRFLQNPSFETFTGTAPTAGVPTTFASTTALTGWVITTIANAQIQLDRTYRGYPGDGTQGGTNLYALRFTGENKATQTPKNTVNPTWVPGQPYYMQVAVYRASSADGDLILRLGATTKTVDLTTLSNNAWNIVTLDLDEGLYYDNFLEQDLTVELEWDNRTTGVIDLDDVILVPMTNLDGTWYVAVGGTTPFLLNDVFTYTDALVGSDAVVQYWWWRAGWGYLPAASSPTITDPT